MTDRHLSRLLLQGQGFGASMEAHLDDVLAMLALQLRGHPKAQDFEPTGHGGSDPTAVNGAMHDRAAKDGRALRAAIERYWTSACEFDDIRKLYLPAKRPAKPDGPDRHDWCVLHLEAGYMEPRAHLDLCEPCYRYKSTHGRYPTSDEVTYYATHYGRWPTQRIDPKAHRK